MYDWLPQGQRPLIAYSRVGLVIKFLVKNTGGHCNPERIYFIFFFIILFLRIFCFAV